MNENKNLLIALSISVLIIIGWQEFYQKPRVVAYKNYTESQELIKKAEQKETTVHEKKNEATFEKAESTIQKVEIKS